MTPLWTPEPRELSPQQKPRVCRGQPGDQRFSPLCLEHSPLEQEKREREILERGRNCSERGFELWMNSIFTPKEPCLSMERMEIVKERPILSLLQTGALSKMSTVKEKKDASFIIYAHLIHTVWLLIPLQIHQVFPNKVKRKKKMLPTPQIRSQVRFEIASQI